MKNKNCWSRFRLSALAVVGLFYSLQASAVDYTVTDLGTLGGGQSEAYGINNSNQVVGSSYDGSNRGRAFYWEANNGMTDIGTLGGGSTSAYGINDSGQVVGLSPWPTSSDNYHAFIWQSGSGMLDLGTLGGSHSAAYAINNNGQVVGNSTPLGDTEYARFLWQNGSMVEMNFGGTPNAINNAGKVVGTTSPGMSRAFLWQNGVTADLGTLGGPGAFGFGINDSDQVIGGSHIADGTIMAFLWQQGTMMNLGSFGGYSTARGINDYGLVVGESGTLIYGQSHAFIWQDGIGMTDLNNFLPSNSGWELINATAINESGAIAGFGTINGQRHAFLMAPTSVVPIPAAVWLFGSGMVGLFGFIRRGRRKVVS